jgi:hypothetical protein
MTTSKTTCLDKWAFGVIVQTLRGDSAECNHNVTILIKEKKMKRLMGLAVLFVVLSVCVPASYGNSGYYYLIYNVSCTVKGANHDVKASIPLKAYLVLRFADGCDTLADANLIMYGKDSSKNKVYVQLNKYSSTTSIIGTELYGGPFVIFDFWTDSSVPFDFQGIVVGKGAFKDIGLGTTQKKWVASSMTGSILVWDGMLLDADDWMTGTGTVSASLYTAATKAVNTYGLTQDQIIVSGYGAYKGIIQTLQAKGFSAATLP